MFVKVIIKGFSFIVSREDCWGWTTQLLSSHCPLDTQNYSQANLRKLQKLFEEM